jgi:chromosome segregation ATPase
MAASFSSKIVGNCLVTGSSALEAEVVSKRLQSLLGAAARDGRLKNALKAVVASGDGPRQEEAEMEDKAAQQADNKKDEQLALLREQLAILGDELGHAAKRERDNKREIQRLKEEASREPEVSSRAKEECARLRSQVAAMQSEIANARTQAAAGRAGEDTAYQQIAGLNTQLASLYAELAVARVGTQKKALVEDAAAGDADPAEAPRQAKKIAELMSDIRHLQLDLQYHQQKLEKVLEEKTQLASDLEKCQTKLSKAMVDNEELDQMQKHQQVDLDRMQAQLIMLGGGDSSGGEAKDTVADAKDTLADALRTELAAKDSALVMAHYELQKEKLMRDRLEQKNLKLLERMQKLMMVVETMRKDSAGLERALQDKDRQNEELRYMSRQKRKGRSASAQQSHGKLAAIPLDPSSLPNLDHRPQRPIDAVGTPRAQRI